MAVYGKVRGLSIEGRNLTILSKLDDICVKGKDELSSSKFKDYQKGDILHFNFKLTEDGKRIVENVRLLESEEEFRNVMTAFLSQTWEDSQFLRKEKLKW